MQLQQHLVLQMLSLQQLLLVPMLMLQLMQVLLLLMLLRIIGGSIQPEQCSNEPHPGTQQTYS